MYKTPEAALDSTVRHAEVRGCMCNEKTVFQQDSEDKWSNAQLSHKSNKGYSGFPDNF